MTESHLKSIRKRFLASDLMENFQPNIPPRVFIETGSSQEPKILQGAVTPRAIQSGPVLPQARV
jgi:hypothetical protein